VRQRFPDGRATLRFEDYVARNGSGLYVCLTPDPDGNVRVGGAVEVSAVRAPRPRQLRRARRRRPLGLSRCLAGVAARRVSQM